jgi:prepilin-type N-terminal cleavage/methylation domain-containing protein
MRNQRGFTLAELLVAIAVVGLLMAALFVTLFEGQSAYLFGSSRAEVQQNGRLALQKIIEEVRTGSGVTALAAAPPSITFTFVNDAGVSTTVTYSLNAANGTVERNQANPVPAGPQPEALVGGVTSLTFTCFDQDGNATTVPGNIFTVQVRITTQPERPLAGYSPANQQVVFEDRASLRNK